MERAALPSIKIVAAVAAEPGAAERAVLAVTDPGPPAAGDAPTVLALMCDRASVSRRPSPALRTMFDQVDLGLGGGGRSARLVPPPRFGLVGRAGRLPRWLPVDLRRRGGRFDTVPMPASMVTADARWLVTSLPGAGIGRSSRPIWAVAAYAGTRTTIAAALARSSVEPGAMADLAAAVPPALVLLAGRWGGRELAVATTDLIAAELVWLTLAEADGGEDRVGPWEDATVQRATELDLGARLPSQLAPEAIHLGGTVEPALQSLLDQLRLRLGIPIAADTR